VARFLTLVLVLPAALAAGCTDPNTPTWHADVQPIVERSCTRCHQDGNIAPFALATYDDAYEVRDAIRVAVTTRTMPPWLAAAGCDEYTPDLSLSDEEIATIEKWAEGGAPRGDPASASEPGQRANGALDRVDLTLQLPEPFTPTAAGDDEYRCFPVAWPADAARYAVGFGVRPGNAKLVHHVIAYVAPPDRAAEVAALDEADNAPGYECFGGPGFGGFPRWLGAWAPGSPASVYPEGTGLEVEPGSVLVMQMHYYLGAARGESDQTAIDIKLADSVDKPAAIIPFANPLWLEGQEMLIPAGATNKVHWFDVELSEYTDEPFLIHSANLHMHRLGTNAVLWVERENGDIDCMLDVPRWDFDWQITYAFTEPKLVQPGDRLGIECQFDNGAANQPVVDGQRAEPRDVAWGDGTGDEMCLGVFYVTNP
jgi:hypothetical protein